MESSDESMTTADGPSVGEAKMPVSGQEGLRKASRAHVSERVEIVIGIVAPLGTDVGPTLIQLEQSLHSVGYTSRTIRLSQLLDDVNEGDPLPQVGEPNYLERRMTAGDQLRERFGSGGALAALCISNIWEDRESAVGTRDGLGAETELSPRNEHATILRSLKHPDEVQLLRQVYGERFILIGVNAPEPDRRRRLIDQLLEESHAFARDEVAAKAEELLRRDSKDPHNDYGQNVRKAFEEADVFVHTGTGDKNEAVDRFIRLLFGDPFVTPERDEMAMAMARVAGLRSSASGRQVGAAITDEHGEVLAVGTNEVPKPGGGQYWPQDDPDDRDFHQEFDPNDQLARRVLSDILDRLRDVGWLKDEISEMSWAERISRALEEDEGDPAVPAGLVRARVLSLIEFGRIVHAELATLMTCARRGNAVSECILYTTTFPCHECARHIIGAGIKRVVYISPYPKSLVREMFERSIGVDAGSDGENVVVFEHYVGISPTNYDRYFVAGKRKDRKTGRIVRWDARSSAPRLGRLTPAGEIFDREAEVLGAAADVLRSSG
jgi:deoxycytidylate deaminase